MSILLDRIWNTLVDASDWIGGGIKWLGRRLKGKIGAFVDFIER